MESLQTHTYELTQEDIETLVPRIKHFKKDTQEEIILLVDLVKKHIPTCTMVILFGSYARGTHVIYDERYEHGVRTIFQSDLDMLVVLANNKVNKHKTEAIERILEDEVTDEYDNLLGDRIHAPTGFIAESISRLNHHLKRKQYFFTDVANEGIVLYDTKEFELAEPQELSFRTIKEIAEEEFDIIFEDANSFLDTGYYHLRKADYKLGSFIVHQACERYYHALGLVFRNHRPKQHDLKKLIAKTKCYSRELATVFPQNTDLEKRSFKLLYKSYREARYNRHFKVEKEEFEYMIERTEILKNISYKLCKDRMEYYDEVIKEQEECIEACPDEPIAVHDACVGDCLEKVDTETSNK